jgi:hypothetical protein
LGGISKLANAPLLEAALRIFLHIHGRSQLGAFVAALFIELSDACQSDSVRGQGFEHCLMSLGFLGSSLCMLVCATMFVADFALWCRHIVASMLGWLKHCLFVDRPSLGARVAKTFRNFASARLARYLAAFRNEQSRLHSLLVVFFVSDCSYKSFDNLSVLHPLRI